MSIYSTFFDMGDHRGAAVPNPDVLRYDSSSDVPDARDPQDEVSLSESAWGDRTGVRLSTGRDDVFVTRAGVEKLRDALTAWLAREPVTWCARCGDLKGWHEGGPCRFRIVGPACDCPGFEADR